METPNVYLIALKALAGMLPEINAFFDQVLVNADDPQTRVNRLALLNRLHALLNQVADLSKLM